MFQWIKKDSTGTEYIGSSGSSQNRESTSKGLSGSRMTRREKVGVVVIGVIRFTLRIWSLHFEAYLRTIFTSQSPWSESELLSF